MRKQFVVAVDTEDEKLEPSFNKYGENIPLPKSDADEAMLRDVWLSQSYTQKFLAGLNQLVKEQHLEAERTLLTDVLKLQMTVTTAKTIKKAINYARTGTFEYPN